jgi:hypothetical protein
MRKTKLVINHQLDETVAGIVSTLKDYKLAWHINQVFNINLAMQPSLLIEFVKGNDLAIVNYLYQNEYQEFRLVRNRGIDHNSGYLIPELVNFDFFLLVNGEEHALPNNSITSKLQSIKGVEYAQQIEVDRLKSKDNFIF